MSDVFDKKKRSEVMARVRGRDTRPEMVVRRILHRLGYRYRLHASDLPGKPDIVLPKHRKVIQVQGCFWHGHPGCSRAKRPRTNTGFWNEKLDRNLERDALSHQALEDLGWHVLVVWGCEINDLATLECRLREFMEDAPG